MPIRFNTIEDLTFALMNEIGLSISSYPEEVIYDQDTMLILSCGNKKIKASIDPARPVFASEYTIIFDPLNFKLMTYFFSYYTSKEESVGNFKVSAFGYQDNGLKGPDYKSNIRIKFAGGDTLESGYYNNNALKICDAILRMGGMIPDLSNFDKVMTNAI